MDSIVQVKEALSARAESTSLEELKSRGRKKVRVIRAEHIASMIEEAVQRTVRDSGLVSSEDADLLVEKSRAEFKQLSGERAREHAELTELRSQLEAAQSRVTELEELVANQAAPAASGSGDAPNMEMMMRLMNEVASIKANMGGTGQPAAGGGGEAGLMAALDKLTSGMNDRLEKFGKKLGVSSAVEATEANLESLFKHVDDVQLESNMDDVKVKSKQSAGIAGNLERLKKLKGGG